VYGEVSPLIAAHTDACVDALSGTLIAECFVECVLMLGVSLCIISTICGVL
jgi:hypothetical protein